MSSNSGDESRAIKRVRLACSNCRRKKVRCSGERPSCSFCQKLSQECHYLHYNSSDQNDGVGSDEKERLMNKESELASRVALLESKLTELAGVNIQQQGVLNLSNQNQSAITDILSNLGVRSDTNAQDASQRVWSQIPPESVVLRACDIFFLHCHNQPYTFFHENKFRRQLRDGILPDHLVFAFLAASMRYSTDPFYVQNHYQALEIYARRSWDIIVSCGFVVDEGIDISVVQAISLLAIIDSAAGRRRAAWVKIGLAVRISQDLGLMMEPDQSLSFIEQEERRRLFWSVYMLDQFVSCSKHRPRSIQDEDCQLRLPCREHNFKDGTNEQTDTLVNTRSGRILIKDRPSEFSLVVLMASALGSCARYALDDRQSTTQLPPWDPSSDYTIIHSTLTYFESLSEIDSALFRESVEKKFVVDGKIDQQQVGHFILQQALFHLSHCLLDHPFLLRQRVQAVATKAPASWLSHAWSSCRDHARSLSSLLREATDLGCMVSTSFYGYCALISGTVHALHLSSENDDVQRQSRIDLTSDIKFLEGVSKYWQNTSLIVSGLKFFSRNSFRYKELLRTTPLIRPLSTADLRILWSVVDYGVMSDPRNKPSNALNEVSNSAIGDQLLDAGQDVNAVERSQMELTPNDALSQTFLDQPSTADLGNEQLYSTHELLSLLASDESLYPSFISATENTNGPRKEVFLGV